MTLKLRIVGRICRFLYELAVILINYLFTVAFAPKKSKRLARAAWLHRSSRRHLKNFHFNATVAGPVPKSGLLISNHLSYLDILAISSVTPAVFVSKADVRRWPLFGWLAELAGSVFVDRERRTHVGAVNREIQTALDEGALVVLFPEGTSSNGENILPFKTSLIEPATRQKNLAIGWIHYEISDGDAGNEVCYWGDHSFFPHLLNLMGKREVRATIRFGQISPGTADRKELARQLRQEVSQLKCKSAVVPGTR